LTKHVLIFSYQICEVGKLVIIHKRTEPDLATRSRGKLKSFGMVLYLGHMLEPIV
jgi:hypothetical protein